MIMMMDARKSGCIAWDDFLCFMTEEIASGKNLLSGEYVLPSGETTATQQTGYAVCMKRCPSNRCNVPEWTRHNQGKVSPFESTFESRHNQGKVSPFES